MDARYLADRIAWGNNLAARRVGLETDAYRPRGPYDPIAGANRYLRLHAAFTSSSSGFAQTTGYGNAVCYGHFDSAYTRPGDYLVQGEQVVFIAAQESLRPVTCVRTNRVLTIRRPSVPAGIGINTYGGLTSDGLTVVLRDWPASVLGMTTAGASQAGLPLGTTLPQWTVLLPAIDGVTVAEADVTQDDRGTRGTVVAVEQSHLGWRMLVRQASA